MRVDSRDPCVFNRLWKRLQPTFGFLFVGIFTPDSLIRIAGAQVAYEGSALGHDDLANIVSVGSSNGLMERENDVL